MNTLLTKNILIKSTSILVLYGAVSYGALAASSSLAPLVEDEAFTLKHRELLTQKAPLSSQPEESKAAVMGGGNAGGNGGIKVGSVAVVASDEARAKGILASGNIQVNAGNIDVEAKDKSKAVGILSKSGASVNNVHAGDIHIKASGNAQVTGIEIGGSADNFFD